MTSSRAFLILLATGASGATATDFRVANRSGDAICISVTEHYATDVSTGEDTYGWTCAADGERVSLGDLRGRYTIAIVDRETGDDHFGRLSPVLPQEDAWTSASVDDEEFGLDVARINAGGYSFAYARGDEEWTYWLHVETFDELVEALRIRGFRQARGWKVPELATNETLTVTLRPAVVE